LTKSYQSVATFQRTYSDLVSHFTKKTKFFRNNKPTKKLFKMAILTFRLGHHIFFILCYLKNHLTFFGDFRSKLFGNILKIFLISCSKFFKLIFLESLAENIWNDIFHYIKICLCFASSRHF
jgi:hypothetical protein